MIEKRSIVLLAALVLVTAGVSAAVYTQPAGATIQVDTQEEPITLTAESADGQVERVNFDFTGTVEWSGFENGVREVGVYPPGDSYVYAPRDRDASSGSFGLNSTQQGHPSVSLQADYFGDPHVDEDGATETTTKTVDIHVEVSGPERTVDKTIEREVRLEVTNLPDENRTMNANIEWDGVIHMES